LGKLKYPLGFAEGFLFMNSNVKKIIELLKDVLFPVFCVECGKEGDWFCEKCRCDFKISPVFACPACGVKNTNGAACSSCRNISFLDGVLFLHRYDENDAIGRLIKFFKYNLARDIVSVWDDLTIGGNIRRSLPVVSDWSVVAVPLFPRRERERGYNQSDLLAEVFIRQLNKTAKASKLNILERSKMTKQQAKLSLQERKENVKSAFVCNQESPASVLLVDDVFTTGSTMQECARVLKEKGAKIVYGLAIVRGG
jgi:ComF family protein